MFCPNCGTQNRDDAKFCTSCGTPFAPAYRQNQQTQRQYQAGQQNQQQPYRPHTQQAAGYATGKVVKKAGGGLLKKVLIGFAVVVGISTAYSFIDMMRQDDGGSGNDGGGTSVISDNNGKGSGNSQIQKWSLRDYVGDWIQTEGGDDRLAIKLDGDTVLYRSSTDTDSIRVTDHTLDDAGKLTLKAEGLRNGQVTLRLSNADTMNMDNGDVYVRVAEGQLAWVCDRIVYQDANDEEHEPENVYGRDNYYVTATIKDGIVYAENTAEEAYQLPDQTIQSADGFDVIHNVSARWPDYNFCAEIYYGIGSTYIVGNEDLRDSHSNNLYECVISYAVRGDTYDTGNLLQSGTDIKISDYIPHSEEGAMFYLTIGHGNAHILDDDGTCQKSIDEPLIGLRYRCVRAEEAANYTYEYVYAEPGQYAEAGLWK